MYYSKIKRTYAIKPRHQYVRENARVQQKNVLQ